MISDRDWETLFSTKGDGFARQLASQLQTGGEKSFSPQFDSSMREMIRQQAARQTGSTWKRQLRAACLALVCLAGLGLGALRVQAIRVPLLDLLVGERAGGSYTQVQFPPLGENSVFTGETADYFPTWVPEGYLLEGVEEDERFLHGSYADASGNRILLSVTPNGGSSVLLDSEDSEVTKTEIGTRGAFIASRKDGRVVILMYDNRYAYTLTSYLPKEEAVKMMKSIR